MKIVYTNELNNYSGVTNVHSLERINDDYYILDSDDNSMCPTDYVEEMLKNKKWTELKIGSKEFPE